MVVGETGLPKRREALLVERVDEELLILDQRTARAHCLADQIAMIWSHCDGSHNARQIAQLCETSLEHVRVVLAEFSELDLLEPATERSRGLARRVATKRTLQAGAGALVLSTALRGNAAPVRVDLPGVCAVAPRTTRAPAAGRRS
jgi:hypothetical protein